MELQKRIWIIGGSSGIGLELVKLCINNKYNVIVSSRNASKSKVLIKLKKESPQKLHTLDLDVTSKKDIKYKTKKAWNIFNGLDIWFYNAGLYDVMSIDSWDNEKFENMNEVNYLGATRLMTELLPYFKISQKGHWIWNASLSSYFGLPHAGGYSAPKAALLNLAESIQPELKLIKIKFQIINHGFVKTRLTNKNEFIMPQLMQPEFAAKKILKGIEKSSSFEIRFPYVLSFFLRVLRFLPYKISLALIKKSLK